MTIDWAEHYATRMSRMVASDIRELMKQLNRPDVISFGGGTPDPNLFPNQALSDSYRKILGDPKTSRVGLQYYESGGYIPLKEWLAGYMGTLGVPCGPDNILITNGSQQGLDYIGRLFLSAGDTVLLEMPTYIGALRAFDSYEASYGPLPGFPESEADGEIVGAKFGYVMPDFQNPMGTSLSLAERNALLDAAEALNLPMVEDSAYEKLRYRGKPIPSLLALDVERAGGIENSRVIYTSTFSKMIAPSLRIGWIVAPAPVIQKMVLIKQASDLCTSTLNQMVMLDVAAELLTEPHIKRLCHTYGGRMDATLRALDTHMPPGITWTRPEGGFYIWITLPKMIDGTVFAQRALRDERVAVVSGKSCYAARPVANTIRLSSSLMDEDKIEEGVRRLGDLLRRMLAPTN